MKTHLILISLFSVVFISSIKREKLKFNFYYNNIKLEDNKYLNKKIEIYSKNKLEYFDYRRKYNVQSIDSIVILSNKSKLLILKSDLNDVTTKIKDGRTIDFEFFDNMEKCYYCDSLTKLRCTKIVLISSEDFNGFFICE